MKNFVILFVSVMLLAGCERKEKPCKPPELAENLVGDWEASFKTTPDKISSINFDKAHNYTEDSDLLLGNFYSPKAVWEVRNDSVIIKATYSNNATSKYSFAVKECLCNEISLDLDGLDLLKMRRL